MVRGQGRQAPSEGCGDDADGAGRSDADGGGLRGFRGGGERRFENLFRVVKELPHEILIGRRGTFLSYIVPAFSQAPMVPPLSPR